MLTKCDDRYGHLVQFCELYNKVSVHDCKLCVNIYIYIVFVGWLKLDFIKIVLPVKVLMLI